MTYEVWYRAGHSLHWWKLPNTVADADLADYMAYAIEAALKQVGFPFAQAEVRASGELVQQDDASQREYASESEASGIVPDGGMMIIGEHFPDQEKVVLPRPQNRILGVFVFPQRTDSEEE
jgi:hypothetical protein